MKKRCRLIAATILATTFIDGKEMTDEQKRAALIQFVNFVIMG